MVNQINLIEDDHFPWDTRIPDNVIYYPVLIVEDPKLCQIGLTGIINNWYQPLIKEELADTACRPMITMSIDTLFLYSETFKEKGFHVIFDYFFKNNVKEGSCGIDWNFNPLGDFNSFVRETFEISSTKEKYYTSPDFDS